MKKLKIETANDARILIEHCALTDSESIVFGRARRYGVPIMVRDYCTFDRPEYDTLFFVTYETAEKLHKDGVVRDRLPERFEP